MTIPPLSLEALWSWAKDKHTAEIATLAGCSTQHVRNVLKGKSEDPAVLFAAAGLKVRKGEAEREAALELQKALAPSNSLNHL